MSMTPSIGAHLSGAAPRDIHLGPSVQVGASLARSIFIASICLTFSAGFDVAKQVEALTELADAATEAAHWLENVAADQKQAVAS